MSELNYENETVYNFFSLWWNLWNMQNSQISHCDSILYISRTILPKEVQTPEYICVILINPSEIPSSMLAFVLLLTPISGVTGYRPNVVLDVLFSVPKVHFSYAVTPFDCFVANKMNLLPIHIVSLLLNCLRKISLRVKVLIDAVDFQIDRVCWNNQNFRKILKLLHTLWK